MFLRWSILFLIGRSGIMVLVWWVIGWIVVIVVVLVVLCSGSWRVLIVIGFILFIGWFLFMLLLCCWWFVCMVLYLWVLFSMLLFSWCCGIKVCMRVWSIFSRRIFGLVLVWLIWFIWGLSFYFVFGRMGRLSSWCCVSEIWSGI